MNNLHRVSLLRLARFPQVNVRAVICRAYSELPAHDGPPLPKAERNPAHKSAIPLPPRNPPAPIAHDTLPAGDYEGAVAAEPSRLTQAIPFSSVAAPAVVHAVPPPIAAPEPIRPVMRAARPVGGLKGRYAISSGSLILCLGLALDVFFLSTPFDALCFRCAAVFWGSYWAA